MDLRDVCHTALKAPVRFGLSTLAIFVVALLGLRAVGLVPYFLDTEPVEGVAHGRVTEGAGYGVPMRDLVALGTLPMLGNESTSTPTALSRAAATVAAPSIVTAAVNPTRIVISSVGIDLPVSNPTSSSIDVLDNALLSAAVRYPGSGRIGEDGNIFIFAHTSHLPVVHNQMFKAFNNLPDLKKGDLIKLEGKGAVALYRVRSVRLTDANEEMVNLKPDSRMLTLATCNTFGEKSSRWIVESDFVGEYATN